MRACAAAGIARGEVVHTDATLIRADALWDNLGVQHADAVLEQGGDKGKRGLMAALRA